MKRGRASAESYETRAANLRRRAVETEQRELRTKITDVLKKHPDALAHVESTLKSLGYFERQLEHTILRKKQARREHRPACSACQHDKESCLGARALGS